MPNLSVIVPVYNTEKYLRRCCESILKNTYTDYELILVNDGSTDQSGEICREYSKYSNVTVINQCNQGVSVARNTGLAHASGKYVIFLDADDYCEINTFELCISAIEESVADILIFGHYLESDGNVYGVITPPDGGVVFDVFDRIQCSWSVWGKVFVKKIIDDNNITFNPALRTGEDFIFNLTYLLHLERDYVTLSVPLYHYLTNRQHSLTNTAKNLESLKLLYSIQSDLMHRIFVKNNVSIEIIESYLDMEYVKFKLSLIINLYKDPSRYNSEFRQKYLVDFQKDTRLQMLIKNVKMNGVYQILILCLKCRSIKVQDYLIKLLFWGKRNFFTIYKKLYLKN